MRTTSLENPELYFPGNALSSQLPDTHRSSFRQTMLEFIGAFRDRFTYSLANNSEVLFGLLWGLPVPLFAVFVHLQATHEAFSLDALEHIVVQHPYNLFFALHPFLFAMVFGAFGTMRARRDLHIAQCIVKERGHSERLASANARLRELDKLKDEFLANVTHELKSPLVTAIGYTDRVLKLNLGPLNDKQRHGLEIGVRNLLRLRGLIDEILDFERVESGKALLYPKSFDLSETIAGVFESTDLKAKEKSIRIEESLPPTPLMLNADPGKIHQVLLNLMDNAIKFSPPGKSVKLCVKPEAGNWHITISDEGPGISQGVLLKLFDRFSQADGSRARNNEGVGLGLVIARKLVELHGGRLWLESQPGIGTTAHVTLPQERADALQA